MTDKSFATVYHKIYNETFGSKKMKIKLKPVNEQVVVVFGASSGIGRQTALDFARRGARLAVASRSESGLASLVEEIKQIGGEAFYKTADAADAADAAAVKAVADETFARYGTLDTWVHTAGTMIFAPFERITPEEFKRLIEVNQLGQVYGAMAALPYLRKAGGGALIHVTSVEAYRTVPYQSAYGSSKHGVKGFLQALRVELQKEAVPISVTEIMPAVINTPIWDKGRNKFKYKEKPPLPPYYHPKIVSDTILFASENEVREMVAGGGGAGVPIVERLSPRLADFISRLAASNQFTDEPQPPGARDGLFDTMPELDVVEGRFSDEQFTSDPYTWAKINPQISKPVLLAAGVLGGIILARLFNKRR